MVQEHSDRVVIFADGRDLLSVHVCGRATGYRVLRPAITLFE
jgi:hypothetical protein